MLALLAAIAAAALLVLADSGLRLWSAFGGIKAQRAALSAAKANGRLRSRPVPRMTTRVSYVRNGLAAGARQGAPLRAAA